MKVLDLCFAEDLFEKEMLECAICGLQKYYDIAHPRQKFIPTLVGVIFR